MTSSRSFRTILLALTAGALGAVGCVITVGEVDCSECNADVDPDPLCHSEFNEASGQCECDDGYDWENPNATDDFECERVDSKPGTGDCGTDPNTTTNANGDCVCVAGFDWCSSDPADLTCCGSNDTENATTVDPSETTDTDATDTDTTDTDVTDTDTSDTQADTSTGGDTGPADLPTCDGTLEGQTACTNNGDVSGVEDGVAYLCEGGEWTAVDMDEICVFDGDDFAYGCYFNDNDEVAYFCGSGPGTDCTDADDSCSSETLLQSCLFGKLTDVDCEQFCTGKEAKIQTDFGTCDSESLTCCCFDEGDEGNCQ
ncbi:MAG: hypothetical protein ACE37F_05780 [Nannocystaceae bacterium]|nr:hypothetical protein [bacterium]